MKSEKGITLISIIIYVIAMVIVVSIVAVLSRYFYRNINNSRNYVELDKQYTDINVFFTEEANLQDNKIIEINDNDGYQKWVAFSSGNQYTYIEENKSLYKNNVKIAKKIEKFNIETTSKNGKQGFTVQISGYPEHSYYFNN